MIKAVIFDLDGTLTDTLGDIANAMNRALRIHGLPEFAVDEYRKLIGGGVRVLTERAVRDRLDMTDAVLATYQPYYAAHAMDVTRPFDGVQDMLHALAERGVQICVFSNKPHDDCVNVVKHFFPDIPFTKVLGQMAGMPVKPDPAGAFLCAQAANVRPDECLYVGDMVVDVNTARNAGMHSVAVTWGFGSRDSLQDAEHVIDKPEQLLGLL